MQLRMLSLSTSLFLLNARCLPSLLLSSPLLARPLFSRAAPFLRTSTALSFSSSSLPPFPPSSPRPALAPGSPIPVEVYSFGPLGASVDVYSPSSPSTLIGRGLILQSEIKYHELSHPPIVVGSRLSAFASYLHPSPHKSSPSLLKVDVSLRPVHLDENAVPLDTVGRVAFAVRQRLRDGGEGRLALGDGSTPFEIESVFPGVSKSRFRKALGKLYEEREIEKPGDHEIRLADKKEGGAGERKTGAAERTYSTTGRNARENDRGQVGKKPPAMNI